MKSEYWNRFKEKVLSLGEIALNMSIPVVIDYNIAKVCLTIESKIKEIYKRTIINSALSLVINLIGILILIFDPFGEIKSRYISCYFFFMSFILWLFRIILFFKNYGKVAMDVSKSIFEQKSVYKGIEEYILINFPLITFIYTGINIASEYIQSLKKVPKLSEVVAYIVSIFWKRFFLFLIVMTVYTVSIVWIIKPLLIRQYF